jgi:hypothetical protein
VALNSGNWPYPVGTDKVVQGDDAIKALADEAAKRLGIHAVVALRDVLTYDANGLNYRLWSVGGAGGGPVTWTALPTVSVLIGQTTAGGDSGVNVQLYQPHNSITQLVTQASYVKDGRPFTGGIDVHIIAIGPRS